MSLGLDTQLSRGVVNLQTCSLLHVDVLFLKREGTVLCSHLLAELNLLGLTQ